MKKNITRTNKEMKGGRRKICKSFIGYLKCSISLVIFSQWQNSNKFDSALIA